MFWKKEVKEESPDLAEAVVPSLDKLTAKIDKINAMVDFLMESKKVDTDKFTRINQQIGELRGEIAEREKKVQNLEIEATRASELVNSVQPEKLLSKIEKENIKIEIVKAKVENQEKVTKEIIKEMKDIKRLVKEFRGTEQVMKLNKEVKEEITIAKKVLSNVDINASKVERLFADFNKEYSNLKKVREDSEKIKTLFVNLKKEIDSTKIQMLSLEKIKEIMDTEKIKKEQKRSITELISKKDEFRNMVGEVKGIFEEIKKIEKNTITKNKLIERLAKESQQRHIIFQDLFLQFQKEYQETKNKRKQEEIDDKNLKDYIRESLINKVKRSEIKKELLKRGWPHKVIENYL